MAMTGKQLALKARMDKLREAEELAKDVANLVDNYPILYDLAVMLKKCISRQHGDLYDTFISTEDDLKGGASHA